MRNLNYFYFSRFSFEMRRSLSSPIFLFYLFYWDNETKGTQRERRKKITNLRCCLTTLRDSAKLFAIKDSNFCV